MALGGADGVNFLTQYQQAGGTAPLIGGSITVDQTVLTSQGKAKEALVGTPSAGPIADTWDDPAGRSSSTPTRQRSRRAFPSPSLFAHGYYINTKAALLALDQVNGDVSDDSAEAARGAGQARLRHADRQGQARREPQRDRRHLPHRGGGRRRRQPLQQGGQGDAEVNQTLGIAEDEFLKLGAVGRDNPSCQ